MATRTDGYASPGGRQALWAATTAVVLAALPDLWPPDAFGSLAIHAAKNSTPQERNVTPIADAAYMLAVLTLYINLPDTPRRASRYDQAVARSLFEHGVPLEVVETAMLLGSLRRCGRPPGALPLGRIRSLAYFSPIIAERQQQPLPAGYLDYLRRKAGQAFPQDVPQTACSQDRPL